ncbi:MAG: antirestriction protein ArdA [Rhizobiales bacterium]|nr:antirestriction protein ArdA [Hyphomicrobiales bacterium]
MTLNFYAQPYDISAEGFYFVSVEEYNKQASSLKNNYGDAIEEFEIQFIDGEIIDCELAKAWGVNQGNLSEFFNATNEWDDNQKTHYIIAVGECGYSHDQANDDPIDIEIDIYELDSLIDLAYQFVEEGLFGDIPERLQSYLDYDKISNDLGFDYTETNIAGNNLIYRCA